MSSPQKREQLKIVIVGAGLAGLMLAILLDRMGVNYVILERAKEIKALGTDLHNLQYSSLHVSICF